MSAPIFGIHLVSLIVANYDEAINFFVHRLGFDLVEDSPATTSKEGRPKRWVVVRPPGSPPSCGVLLAQADGQDQQDMVGRQWAGRVGMFWNVENFDETFGRLIKAGVRFAEEPRREAYGKVAVFYDVAGNKWDLIGTKRAGDGEDS